MSGSALNIYLFLLLNYITIFITITFRKFQINFLPKNRSLIY